jgi:cytochrome P450
MVEYSPYDWDTAVNPYPVYRELRDHAPVYHNEKIDFWTLARYEDVVAAHSDPETYRSSGGVTIEGSESATDLLIVKDLPEHRWHRKLVNGVFTPRRIAELEPFIRARAAQLLDRFRDQDEFDVVSEFSLTLPLDVISELLGIPAELRPMVHHLSNVIAARENTADPAARVARGKAHVELHGLYLELVRKRHVQPRDDVISLLLESEVVDGEDGTVRRLPEAEVATRFLEMGFAGHETVAKLIPNALVGLFWYPDQRRELIEDPTLGKGAVEEFLRWDPPSHLQGRTTSRDVELHGTTIPAGEKVMLLTAAASHDDRVYQDPELLDIHRVVKKQVGFGYGIHACLGAAIARLETRIAIEEVLARFPDYGIDGTRAERVVQANVRGLSALPLLTARP